LKALVKQTAESGLWLADMPEPTIGINDVLVRVEKTGICGIDVHIYNWDAWARRTNTTVISVRKLPTDAYASSSRAARYLSGK
jgi:threonine dehydrogenase-like Zn-dependent dehydrogenase